MYLLLFVVVVLVAVFLDDLGMERLVLRGSAAGFEFKSPSGSNFERIWNFVVKDKSILKGSNIRFYGARLSRDRS